MGLVIFFALDMMLLIMYPFNQVDKRPQFYYALSFIGSFILATGAVFSDKHSLLIEIFFQCVRVCVAIHWLISIISIIFVICKLCKPGISQEVRKQVVNRYIATLIIFILTNLYITLGLFIMNIDDVS